jgi:hypothetical protein
VNLLEVYPKIAVWVTENSKNMKCGLPIFETNPYLKNQEGFGTKNMGALISANPHVAGSVSPDAIDSSTNNLEFHEFAYEHFYGRLQLQTFLS